MMRIPCESGDFVSIELAENTNPSDEDLLVVVEVQCRGFFGRVDTWILQAAWTDFCEQMSQLEYRRQGIAAVESISPKELRLTFRSTDRAGHMGIEGLLGYRGALGETMLSFSIMAFDPSLLPDLLRGARQIARALNDRELP